MAAAAAAAMALVQLLLQPTPQQIAMLVRTAEVETPAAATAAAGLGASLGAGIPGVAAPTGTNRSIRSATMTTMEVWHATTVMWAHQMPLISAPWSGGGTYVMPFHHDICYACAGFYYSQYYWIYGGYWAGGCYGCGDFYDCSTVGGCGWL